MSVNGQNRIEGSPVVITGVCEILLGRQERILIKTADSRSVSGTLVDKLYSSRSLRFMWSGSGMGPRQQHLPVQEFCINNLL
jgi:hypothetical protein